MSEERLPWDVHGCRPGRWRALVRADLLLVLGPEEESRRVAELWAAADRGEGFDGVLDVLVREGLGRCGPFLLVGAPGGTPRMLVRGGLSVRLAGGGPGTDGAAGSTGVSHQGGSGTHTWREVALSGVAGFTVVTGDGPDDGGDPLPVWGLVGVSTLAVGAPPRAATDGPGRQPEGQRPTGQGDAHTVSPAVPQTASPVAPGGDVPGSPAPAPASVSAASPPADHGHLEAGPPGAADEDDHTTQLPPRPGVVPLDQQSPEGGAPAPAATRPVARVEFSHGEVVEVDRSVLVGRAPEARRFSADDHPRLVTVPSPLGEISGTHLELRPGAGADRGTAVVTDLGSTNGTRVTRSGLAAAEEIAPGVVTPAPPGTTIDLGDGVTILVGNA